VDSIHQDNSLDAREEEIGVELVSGQFMFLWQLEIMRGLGDRVQQAQVRRLWHNPPPRSAIHFRGISDEENNRTR
jgi:hypothetical protein